MQEYSYNKEELLKLAEDRKYISLREKLTHLNEVDTADFITALPETQQMLVFSLTEKEVAADVFANLPVDNQEALIDSLNDQQLSAILEDLAVDDMVDMIGELPANMVKRILKRANPETRELINKFLRYPEDSAGSIMTAEFIDLKKEMTVKDAIAKIKKMAQDMETIYTVYVTDLQRQLEGIVSFKDIILAKDSALVEDIMEKDIISIKTTDDQEHVAEIFNKYDFLSIPVVDAENRLVGIVTVDDAVDVMEDEATEDIEKMAALQPSEKPYLKTSVIELASHRIVWLLVLMISGMLTGGILGHFEEAFVAIPLLVTFIPMLTDTGGNSGSQASTLIIRGMTVGEIQAKDFFKVVWKELRVSFVVGVILGTVNFLRIILFYKGGTFLIALTVSLAMACTVMLAKTLGCILPIL
nr:magnesium transporter [Treponema sp.]